jgi:DNA segregation ATPase FtsK/SpoIIIE, S-DNA-T family
VYSNDDSALNNEDELYESAVEIVRVARKASASLLQRRLRIGYARAARLLDLMEEGGIVGPANGARPREVCDNNSEEI